MNNYENYFYNDNSNLKRMQLLFCQNYIFGIKIVTLL